MEIVVKHAKALGVLEAGVNFTINHLQRAIDLEDLDTIKLILNSLKESKKQSDKILYDD